MLCMSSLNLREVTSKCFFIELTKSRTVGFGKVFFSSQVCSFYVF